MSGRVLVTGADGYLGRRVSARLLLDSDEELVLAVRAADRAELSAKRDGLLRELTAGSGGSHTGEATLRSRVRVVPADVTEPEPFAAIERAGLTGVVHAAARTAFNVDRTLARRVNVEGTRRLAEFAHSCQKLERLLVLSTLYSAGRRVGVVTEAGHTGDGEFVNHYEWSKHEAERHLLTSCADLPLTIARLATIVADDGRGEVRQYNAFHNTLKMFYYGLLSLMPGEPATRLYLATAEFTCRGLAYLARPTTPGGVFHLAPGPEESVTLGQGLDAAFAVFESDPGYRRRRLLRPEFCDIDSFRDLVAASSGLSASPMAQALSSVAPFAEQMFLPKEFDNTRLRAAWPDYRAGDPRALVEATCTRLVASRWGRNGDRNPAGDGEETPCP
jgi:nucleoside-diphosphate-sugar epimerase